MRLIVLLLTVLPLPAFALSCLPYGVTDAYLEAEAAEEGYVPVLGTLEFAPDLLPKPNLESQQDTPPLTLVPASFEGDALNIRGVDTPFATDVVLEVRCFGPWCPSPEPGPVLAFLRKTSHSYVLATNSCGGFLFSAPTQPQIEQLRDCLAGRTCQPTAPR
jgi:hypothetical protein